MGKPFRFLLARISLRWQLAMLYVACLSVALGLLGVALYFTLSYILEQSVYSQLQADAQRLTTAGQFVSLAPADQARSVVLPFGGRAGPPMGSLQACSGGGVRPCYAAVPPTPGPVATSAVVATATTLAATPTAAPVKPTDQLLGQLVSNGVVARYVDVGGNVVAQGGDATLLRGLLTPSRALVASLDATGRPEHADSGKAPERLAILYDPVTAPGGGQGVLEVAASLRQVDIFLSIFHFALLIGGVVALGGGTFIALALTRRVLQPLHRMAGVSWTVASGDLSRRFTGPTGSREVAMLARNFNHMIDRLEASVRGQQRFTADAAHELRTPLTALGGNVELLLLGADEGDPQRVQKALRSMDLEIQRLTRLVNDLLQLSRMEGQTHLQLAPLDVASLLRDVGAELRLVGKHAVLDVRADGPLPVVGDRDKLKQVLLNVGDNALKFTPPGGVVALTAQRMGTAARLRISDSGPGIPPGDLPRIFDRFYRSDVSRARASGGLGLGLAIAKAIVDAHHGSIVASSVPGKGATFTIDLPLDAAVAPAAVGSPRQDGAPIAPAQTPAPAYGSWIVTGSRRAKARR